MIRILIASLILLLTVACSDKPVEIPFMLDNPTNQAVTVVIDDKSYTLEPNTEQALMLTQGEHKIKADAVGERRFIVYNSIAGGLINPTLSNYILVKQIYATENSTHAESLQRSQQYSAKVITIDGVEIEGNFTLYNRLFITNQWDYGVHEDFPEEAVMSNSVNATFKTKIYNEKDFIALLEGDDNKGYFEKNRKNLPKPEYVPFDPLSALAGIKDEAILKKLEPLVSAINAYADSSAPEEQLNRNLELVKVLTSIKLDIQNDLEREAHSMANKAHDDTVRAAALVR